MHNIFDNPFNTHKGIFNKATPTGAAINKHPKNVFNKICKVT